MRTLIRIGLVALAVTFLAFGCAKKYEVPNVVGLTQEETKRKLSEDKEAQLSFDIKEQYDNTVPKGVVIFQDPQPDASVAVETTVLLVISRGPPVAPNVVGLTQEEAKRKLSGDKEAQLSFDIKEQYDNTVPKGVVISQNPQPDASVAVKTTVSLVISRGRPVVPKLVGKSKDVAEQLVKQAQLVFSSGDEYSDSAPRGNVISQKPAPGTSVRIGSPVKVSISKGLERRSIGPEMEEVKIGGVWKKRCTAPWMGPSCPHSAYHWSP